ncbi:hypothetical protein BDQ17DRAFT_1366989 [Cyathus striatus]|nr:hypothetical protein BDQ17DRAFT_1366989 [Cyathus striatus]
MGTPVPADNRSYILSQVFDHLRDEKRTLAVAARAHRLFTELALDKLWKSLDSLFPLFKILPAFQESDGTYVLRGTVHPHDWDRFDWYARRVRVFCYTRDLAAIDIAMHVYFRVAQLRNSPLLPELQYLLCPSLSQSDILIPAICLFLSPSLQSIQFGEITSIEDKLGAELENVILKGERDALSKDSLSFLTRFRHLKKLELCGMGRSLYPELLQGLGTLAYLEQLDIDFRHCPLKSLDEEIGMSSLKRLSIKAPISWTAAFLSRIALGDVDTKTALEDIAARLGEVLLTSSLIPLLTLHELRYVCLEGDDVKIFAYSWPKIQYLLLPFAPMGFPRHLSLPYLRIPLDTGVTVPNLTEEEERELSRERHRLQILTLASGDDPLSVKELLQLARYIDFIFPHIHSVKTYPDDGDDIWDNIKDMISTFQSVRSEAINRTFSDYQSLSSRLSST